MPLNWLLSLYLRGIKNYMRIKGGYILLSRQIDNSDVMKMPPATRELWLYILRKVNHSDYKNLKRGENIFHYEDIQNDLSWYIGYRKVMYKKYEIAKSLRRLCESNMIATTKTTRGVIIKVLRYDDFQNPANYESNSEGQAKAMRKQQSSSTIYKKNKEEKECNKYICSFETFWNKYPKKVGKTKAEVSYSRKATSKEKEQQIFDGLEKYIKKWKLENTDKQYIPNPTTWLNQERWNDEVEVCRDVFNKFARNNEEKWEKVKQEEKKAYENKEISYKEFRTPDGQWDMNKLNNINKKGGEI